jgi:hypothetical protein
VHEASTIEMVAPDSTAPVEVVASIGRMPSGRITVCALGVLVNVAPGTLDAEADAVVSSVAQ